MSTDDTSGSKSSGLGDVRGLLRQIVTPVIDQVETRVSSQIDHEVAQRIDELLSTRMATIDRAIGALDRHVTELAARLDRLEGSANGELSDAAETAEAPSTPDPQPAGGDDEPAADLHDS